MGSSIKEFYVPFHNLINKSELDVERVPRSEIDEESDEVCETSYRDRGGKYQGQKGVTLPRT